MPNTALTEAFHSIYDAKDANLSNETVRVQAYDALAALAALMQTLNVPVPRRFDGEGRVSNHPVFAAFSPQAKAVLDR